MTKKLAKLFGIGLLCIGLFLTGCGSNSIARLSGGPSADAKVDSQYGAVVTKGDYLYFINGVYDSSVSSEFGKADVAERGYIYRAELNADGTLKKDSIMMLCPKQVYTASVDAGLFLVGDRLYFGAVSTHRDKRGQLLTSYLDLYTVKLDGTDCREISYLTANTYTSKWMEKNGKAYFVYIDTATDTKGIRVVDEKGNNRRIVEKYVGTPILGDDNYVYYTTQIEKPDQEDVEEDEIRYESYYEVYRKAIDGGEAELVLAKDSEVVNEKNAVTLTKVENGVLYYTYTDGASLVRAYDLSSKKSATLSHNALTTVHKYLGFNEDGCYKGVIATYESKLMFIRPDATKTSGYEEINLLERFSAVPSTILTIEDNWLYYSDGSSVCRVDIGTYGAWKTHSEGDKIYGAAVNTTTFMPEVIGGYIYFLPTATDHPTYASYLYRLPKTNVITDEMEEDDIPDPEFLGQLTKGDQETFDKAQEKIDKENEKKENNA